MKFSKLSKIGALALAFAATACSSVSSEFDTSKAIKLYSRDAGSGTRECFFEGIGYSEVKAEDKWESGVTVSSAGSNADIMSNVGGEEYGIGYCSLDSVSSVSTIKALKFEGVEATKENVLNGTYKLKRNFNYVLRNYDDEADASKKQACEGFIDFLTNTTEGQTVISTNGGIISARTDLKSFKDIESKYAIFTSDEQLNIDFCGSTSVETIIKAAVEKLTSLVSNKKLTYTLNQSGSGDAVNGITEGKNGKLFGIGFLSREIKTDEAAKLTDDNTKGSFAIDAVVPIVNAKNTSYTETTAEELTKMYKGEYKVWSDVLSK